MHFSREPIIETSPAPAPPDLIQRLRIVLPGARRVVIQAKGEDGRKSTQLNAIDLQFGGPGAMPKDEVPDIAEAVQLCLHAIWEKTPALPPKEADVAARKSAHDEDEEEEEDDDDEDEDDDEQEDEGDEEQADSDDDPDLLPQRPPLRVFIEVWAIDKRGTKKRPRFPYSYDARFAYEPKPEPTTTASVTVDDHWMRYVGVLEQRSEAQFAAHMRLAEKMERLFDSHVFRLTNEGQVLRDTMPILQTGIQLMVAANQALSQGEVEKARVEREAEVNITKIQERFRFFDRVRGGIPPLHEIIEGGQMLWELIRPKSPEPPPVPPPPSPPPASPPPRPEPKAEPAGPTPQQQAEAEATARAAAAQRAAPVVFALMQVEGQLPHAMRMEITKRIGNTKGAKAFWDKWAQICGATSDDVAIPIFYNLVTNKATAPAWQAYLDVLPPQPREHMQMVASHVVEHVSAENRSATEEAS